MEQIMEDVQAVAVGLTDGFFEPPSKPEVMVD